jgi:hypothetical protein
VELSFAPLINEQLQSGSPRNVGYDREIENERSTLGFVPIMIYPLMVLREVRNLGFAQALVDVKQLIKQELSRSGRYLGEGSSDTMTDKPNISYSVTDA